MYQYVKEHNNPLLPHGSTRFILSDTRIYSSPLWGKQDRMNGLFCVFNDHLLFIILANCLCGSCVIQGQMYNYFFNIQ